MPAYEIKKKQNYCLYILSSDKPILKNIASKSKSRQMQQKAIFLQ